MLCSPVRTSIYLVVLFRKSNKVSYFGGSIMKKFLILLLAASTLAACQIQEKVQAEQEASSSVSVSIDQVTISVTANGEKLSTAEAPFQEGDTLLEVMEDNFAIETADSDYGAFITSIEDYAQDDSQNLYWLFDVNGEMATVGASEYILEEDDQIDWYLGE